MEHARVRVDTPYPLSPQKLVSNCRSSSSSFHRSTGCRSVFPGMVRGGHILSAPHFVCPAGPGGSPVPKLVTAWSDFDLATSLTD